MLIFVFSSLSSTTVDVYFSPNDHVRSHILRLLDSTKKSVDVAMFSFTDMKLAKKIAELSKRFKVRVLLDPRNANDNGFSKAYFLSDNNVNVRYAKVLDRRGIPGIMHDKFAIIDDKTVITGSYNWTVSANLRNNENLVVIRNKPVEKLYENEFLMLWRNGTLNVKHKSIETISTKNEIMNNIGKVVIINGKIRGIRKGRSVVFVYFKGIKRFKMVVFNNSVIWKKGDNVKLKALIENSERYGLEGIYRGQIK